MKKLLLLALITLNSLAYSQVAAYHMVYVKSVDQAKFETVEKEYMSKMAQNAVNEGKFAYWSLEKFIHPMVPIGGKLNSSSSLRVIVVFSSFSSWCSCICDSHLTL